MKRKASAVWRGGLKGGNGRLSTDSGVLADTPYSFSTRFEEGRGTNPEELIAAAHAGCFAMALSMILGELNIEPEEIRATAVVTLEQADDGFSISASDLSVTVRAPGADPKVVEEAAGKAKAGCPVSKALNAGISLAASLE